MVEEREEMVTLMMEEGMLVEEGEEREVTLMDEREEVVALMMEGRGQMGPHCIVLTP